MSDFSNIIQEINTNIPDNTSQSITAAKLRDTLIDLTEAIEDQQDSFESGLVIDDLNSSDSAKSLSAAQGRELKLRGNTIVLEGSDNSLVSNRVYCYNGHKYRVWLDNTELDWSNITYTSSSYVLFDITVTDYDESTVLETKYSRGCNDKVTPLQSYYDFTVSNDGILRIRFRANTGEKLMLYVDDITFADEVGENIESIENVFSTETDVPTAGTTTGTYYKGSVGDTISTSSSTSFRGRQYAVTPGHRYHYHAKFNTAVSSIYAMFYTSETGVIINRFGLTTSGQVDEFDDIITIPENVAYVYMNTTTFYDCFFKEVTTNFDVNINDIDSTVSEHTSQITSINGQIETINGEIEEIQDSFNYIESEEPAQYDSTISGSWWGGAQGDTISSNSSASSTRGRRFLVNPSSTYHIEFNIPSQYYGFYVFRWVDENGIIVKRELWISNTGSDHPINGDYVAPADAVYLYINYTSSSTPTVNEVIYGTADIGEMASDIEQLKDDMESISSSTINKLMKVVIRAGFYPENYGWSTAYYIRTKYNGTQDIIIQNQINSNSLLSFYAAYVGPNDKNDSTLMTSTYRVCDCSDSTAPFFGSTLYWHLYAQHGVPIPVINNNVNMTTASVGSLWQDTITSGGEPFVRQYHIGYVNDSKIYLLPVYYEGDDGRITRGWKNEANSTAITTLEFVDAGTGQDEGISTITVAGYTQVQKRPIIQNTNRHFYCDSIEITEPGTYYCDELKVSESQIGYNPASISDADYFSGPDNRVNLEGASRLAEFTWSYLYKGATCAMNTTVKLLGDFRCQSYGAIQQQYFHNLTYNGTDYTAKFLIPKCKKYTMNVPFSEPSATRQYYRTSTDLVDVDDPVDRQIGWLVNTGGTNDYRIGLAAGLSLVTGDTVREKRIQNIPEGDRPSGASDTSSFWRLGSISPSNTNKFYIAAINAAPYADQNYNLPAGLFKEINCYVSYFDPAANLGQVYWYKDGNSYIIYCHSQEAADTLAINVPEYMEGLQLSVVEKTDNATLLTSTITNGKFFITYTGEDQVKYIVLKAN